MKVSVITTCYNAQNVIEKTIKSVLSQTADNFEYIIQDGGSTDGTADICMSYKKAFLDRNIPFYFYSEKDSGIYDGMNKGVSKATGEFVNFMNADDYYYDFDVITNVIITDVINNSDIIYGDAVEYECGNYYKYKKDIGRITRSMPFSHQSVFAKRELLLKHPFDTTLSIGADYDFLLTAYMDGCIFSDIGKYICVVSRDGKSSKDLYNTFIETAGIQKRHGIENYTDRQYAKKLKELKVKQFVMDNIPDVIIQKIRLAQRKSRGQDELVDIQLKLY